MKILTSGSRVIPCGRKDRHYEANSRFSQFYELALRSHETEFVPPTASYNDVQLITGYMG